jgi:hypothetical protein
LVYSALDKLSEQFRVVAKMQHSRNFSLESDLIVLELKYYQGMHVCPCLLGSMVMKKILLSLAIVSCFSFSAFAQTAAAPAASPAAASVTAVCKDGTPFSGAKLKGACRGHGGVDKKAAIAGANPAAAAAPAAATAKVAASAQPASGGGEGKVWVNSSTKVYHCEGDRWYGKTKKGEYMSAADAKAKGFHADHGKECAK